MAENSARYKAILSQEPLPDDLLIQYSDLHGYHGGIAFELRADGTLIRQEMKRGQKVKSATRRVKEAQVREVAALLIALEAWEQRIPERAPDPDESRAHLRIMAGGEEAHIWEWYNDLPINNRLSQLLDRLQELFSQTET